MCNCHLRAMVKSGMSTVQICYRWQQNLDCKNRCLKHVLTRCSLTVCVLHSAVAWDDWSADLIKTHFPMMMWAV